MNPDEREARLDSIRRHNDAATENCLEVLIETAQSVAQMCAELTGLAITTLTTLKKIKENEARRKALSETPAVHDGNVTEELWPECLEETVN